MLMVRRSLAQFRLPFCCNFSIPQTLPEHLLRTLPYPLYNVSRTGQIYSHLSCSRNALRMLSSSSPDKAGETASLATESAKQGEKRLHMVFTCTKCETRAVKSFTKNAYENGVVIVTCPGCEARHLVADNLGWFGPDDESNIEKILAKNGQSVTRITGDIDYFPTK